MAGGMKYEVKTTPYVTGDIVQEVLFIGDDNIQQVILRQVMHTKEHQVRLALIELGWTPPA